MAVDPADQRHLQNEFLRAPFVGSFSNAGNKCVRTFIIPYEEYFDAVKLYLGWTELISGVLKRHLPYRDFVHQGMVAEYAEVRGLAYDGVDEDEVLAPMNVARAHRYALVTVTFATPRYQLGEFANDPADPTLGADVTTSETERFCQKEVRSAKDFVTAQPGVFQWTDDDEVPIPNAKVQFPIPVLQSTADIIITWMHIPVAAVPITAIKACMGKVNNATLALPPIPPPATALEEQLLLLTWTPTDVFFPDDTLPNAGRAMNITYMFKYIVQGWNHAPRPSGGYARIVRDGVSLGRYATADFSALFQPEP